MHLQLYCMTGEKGKIRIFFRFLAFTTGRKGERAFLFSERMGNPERNIFKKGKLASDLQILSVR